MPAYSLKVVITVELTQQEYKAIVENAPNLIWRAGLDAQCDYFNKTWLDFTGHTYAQEYGSGWAKGVHPDDLERCVQTYMSHFEQRTSFEMEYRLLRNDGQWRWINDRGAPYADEHGVFMGFIGSCMDVTDKVEGSIYKEISQRDSLTGALSRQYLMSQLQRGFEQARTAGGSLAVAMMDIDKFKHINDTYGHLMGDAALKLFASVVRDKIRVDDLFGRYGGDEFLVTFRNASTETVHQILERIQESLPIVALKANQEDVTLTISVGVCVLTDETSTDEMIHKADQMMYEQKQRKKLVSTDEP